MSGSSTRQSLDEINALLADAAEELRLRWEEISTPSRSAEIGAWVAENMPRIESLSDLRRSASQAQSFGSIDDLADRLGWRDHEKKHAIDCVRDDPGYGESFGDECVIATHSGRELRSPADPQSCDYLRVTQHGFELAYWTSDEWREDPEVLGAIMGCLKHDAPAPEAEDLTCTFDVRRSHERQGGVL